MLNKKKLKKIYFGGTEEELIQVFEDMEVSDTVFEYWAPHGKNDNVEGFLYFTVDPRVTESTLNYDPDNTGLVIAKTLAEKLLLLPPLDPLTTQGKRRVWTLTFMKKRKELGVIATATLVDVNASYTVSRRSTSLKLN